MRMGSHHHIHFLFQKDLCPLFLKGIHIPAVFRSPMGKHNHGIRLFPGLSDILPHLSFLFQKMYHIRIFLWQGNPVCAVRYIKQRQFHIVAHHDLVRTPLRLPGRLNAETQNAMVRKEFLCSMNPFDPSVKCMVGRTSDNIKSGMYHSHPHFCRRSETGIIPVLLRLPYKRRLLIYDGYVTFRNHIPHIVI